MAKTTAVLVLALLTVAAITNAARPLPERLNAGIEDSDAAKQVKSRNDEGCDEAGKEECLARRLMLDAHTDYIYTQQHNP